MHLPSNFSHFTLVLFEDRPCKISALNCAAMSGMEGRQGYARVVSDPCLLSDHPKRSQDIFLMKTHTFVCKVSFASRGVSIACEHAESKLHTWERYQILLQTQLRFQCKCRAKKVLENLLFFPFICASLVLTS